MSHEKTLEEIQREIVESHKPEATVVDRCRVKIAAEGHIEWICPCAEDQLALHELLKQEMVVRVRAPAPVIELERTD